jgi:chromosome segregation protein
MSERIERLNAALRDALSGLEHDSELLPRLSARSDQVLADLAAAEAELTNAAEAARSALAESSGWQARAEALELALDEARHRAGAERLADVDGVLGTLLDLLDVDAGWTDAFEAAAGEALGAVVVSGRTAAREALSALASGDHSGAVIALDAMGSADVTSGTPGIGSSELRNHVRPASAAGHSVAGNWAAGQWAAQINRLLDVLIADAAVVDTWSEALDLAVASPTRNVVTRDGHRFGLSGWRLRASGTGATGAALEEARARCDSSAEKAKDAQAALDSARTAAEGLRTAEAASRRELATAEAEQRKHAEAESRLTSEISETSEELRGISELIERMEKRLGDETARLNDIALLLPDVEAAEAELSEKAAAMVAARGDLEARSSDLQTRRSEADLRGASVTERERFVSDRLAHLDSRLVGLSQEADAAEGRREILEARLESVIHLRSFLAEHAALIESRGAEVARRRKEQSDTARSISDRLSGLRSRRAELSGQLEELREKLQRAEVAHAEIRVRLESATDLVRNELEIEPAEALAATAPEIPEGATPAGRARDLRLELKRMGQINPLALAEFEEHAEREQFLQGQLDDIKSSRRELNKVIRAVDGEIVQVFSAAFADVSENFTTLFHTLFPGGNGRLRLTNPDDLLNTGIEVEAKPSGKNVRKLSLLSGGERSLTALAYLFAVFRSRPSPFYVMDEVEAALDDVNLHRFLELVAEFRSTAQLLIVSHQKRTMEAADVLFGVSMDPGGSSKVVSETAEDVVDLRA